MNNDLLVKSEEKTTVTRLQSGQLLFQCFSFMAGVRFLDETSGDKDVTHIKLDDFARAFHGTATKTTQNFVRSDKPRLSSPAPGAEVEFPQTPEHA